MNTGSSVSPAMEPSLHRSSIVRTLVAAALLGHVLRMNDDAETVQAACAAMLGNGRSLRIGMSLASAMAGDLGPARTLMTQGAADWGVDAAPEMLAIALALKLGGEPEWMSLVESTLQSSAGPAMQQIVPVHAQPDERSQDVQAHPGPPVRFADRVIINHHLGDQDALF
jgi:hypothetical protein